MAYRQILQTTVGTEEWVTYLMPGSMVTNESTVPANGRDPEREARAAGSNIFGFYFYTVVACTVVIDGENIITRSEHRDRSKTYYIDGKIIDLDTIIATQGEHSALAHNVRSSGLQAAVCCRAGNFQLFDPEKHEVIAAVAA